MKRFSLSALALLVCATLIAPTHSLGQDQQDDGWVQFLPGGVGARMRVPVEPKHNERTMTPNEDTEITLHTYMSTVQNGKLTYLFSHFEMVDVPVGKTGVAKRLDEAVQGHVFRVNGEVEKHTAITMQKIPGREFVYRFQDNRENKFKIHTRLFIRGKKMYEVKVVGLEESFSAEDAAKFFDSFAFTSKVNPMPKPDSEEATNDR